MSASSRAIAYIDGYNLYYGIRSKEWERFLWLDIPALIAQFLPEHALLTETKYFTSRVTSPADSVKRQTDYIDALKDLGVSVIEGRHGGDPLVCGCGRTYAMPGEKMTDVNVALEVARDAYLTRFDMAVIVTGDSDQVPTVRLIREVFPNLKVMVLSPPNRVSSQLVGSAHIALNINKRHLRTSQLPDTISLKRGHTVSRPAKWARQTEISN